MINRINYKEIETVGELNRRLKHKNTLQHYAFQAINFRKASDDVKLCRFIDCLFMGCDIPEDMYQRMDSDCIVFPRIKVPFRVFPNKLYSPKTLYRGYDRTDEASFETCYDTIAYKHYMAFGKETTDIKETLARSLHDHSITNARNAFLSNYPDERIVGIMGGHALKRTDEGYRNIVLLSKKLTEHNCLMISGGGPGALEATHVGAWMAGRDEKELDEALEILSVAPTFRDPHWLSSAFEVIERFPQDKGFHSLGIPTWFYGHEPSTPFATDIAKYFDNSIREEGITAVAKGGLIYTPGSAGTLEEIFKDAAQNHYLTFGCASPMIFMGKDYYTNEIPVYPLFEEFAASGKMNNLLLSITDDINEIISTIMMFHIK